MSDAVPPPPGPDPRELAAAERKLRFLLTGGLRTYSWESAEMLTAVRPVMAEYDRLRADRDRWQHLAEGWHRYHNEALDARDKARAERDHARARIAALEAALPECDVIGMGGQDFVAVPLVEVRRYLDGESG